MLECDQLKLAQQLNITVTDRQLRALQTLTSFTNCSANPIAEFCLSTGLSHGVVTGKTSLHMSAADRQSTSHTFSEM
jgi:hypothetical protein